MTSTFQKILESKRALRHDLARRPVAEKLRMVEEMRERLLAAVPGSAAAGKSTSTRLP